MESNWRLNVVTYGCVGKIDFVFPGVYVPVLMIAEEVGTGRLLTNVAQKGATIYGLSELILHDGVVQLDFPDDLRQPAGGNFPYGRDVLPDV